MNINKKILVIGSSNVDLCLTTNEFPEAGETVMGSNFITNTGGKGANQTVAAARLGANVTFVSCVGNDDYGNLVIQNLEKDNIDTKFITKYDNESTGIAVVIINKSGENEIVIIPGANNLLSENHINDADEIFYNADIILLQQEIPSNVVEYVIEKAKKMDKKVILNFAPARYISDYFLQNLYMLVLNETETQYITGYEIKYDENIVTKAAEDLINKGVQNVIITLGAKGSFVYNKYFVGFIDSFPVQVVDTTAAGDTFVGALSVALQEDNIKEAVIFASKAAAFSVGKKGAQMSMPYLDQII